MRRVRRDRRGRFAATMPCCGAPVFWFRPFQCVHDYQRFIERPTLWPADSMRS